MAEAVLGKSNVVRVLGCDLKYWAYVCKERPVLDQLFIRINPYLYSVSVRRDCIRRRLVRIRLLFGHFMISVLSARLYTFF